MELILPAAVVFYVAIRHPFVKGLQEKVDERALSFLQSLIEER